MPDDLPDYERFCADAYPQLVAAFTHQFGDRWLAEELAQEALIRAGVRWNRVRSLRAPIGWAFRVGCNLGVSAMRRRSAELRALRRRPVDNVIELEPDEPDLSSLRRALDALPEAQRRAVVARYYLDLTAEEAAASLGTTAGNIRVMTHRALQKLRSQVNTGDTEEPVRVS